MGAVSSGSKSAGYRVGNSTGGFSIPYTHTKDSLPGQMRF
jgi:hypothetical protein